MTAMASRPALRATKRNISDQYIIAYSMVSDFLDRAETHRDSFSSQLCTVRAEPRQLPHMDRGERAEKSKNIQEPQNYPDNHDSIQDRLNRSCHRYVAINQSEENTNHDQDQYELN
jgi:hypothetical protein